MNTIQTLMFLTFGSTVFAWIFFRAVNIKHALNYINGMFTKSLFSLPEIRPTDFIVILILFMLFMAEIRGTHGL